MSTPYEILTGIQAEVLGYLEDHPEAFDTADGIHQWWLMRRLAQFSAERVQSALDQLVAAGLIEVHVLDDGQLAYCRSACRDQSRATNAGVRSGAQ